MGINARTLLFIFIANIEKIDLFKQIYPKIFSCYMLNKTKWHQNI